MVPWLVRLGFRRGVLGGSRPFLVVWIALMGLRLLKKLGGNDTEVVYSEVLRPGEKVLLTHEAPEPRRRRRSK